MSNQIKKFHPALKHGAFSATAILPGEDPAAFRDLHQKLIAELTPIGALEDDIVATIARLLWRKKNLATLRIAELALEHHSRIEVQKRPSRWEDLLELEVPAAEREAALQATELQAREELGNTYELVELGETATVDRLLQDLGVEERLDARIDKSLKRLLFLRGLKSLSPASSSAAPQPVRASQRIPGPTRVA
jgi:hypothetical protein